MVEDDRLAMLFLFPGLEIFLRINGRGRVSTAPDLLDALKEGPKTPKAAVVVTVEQVLFHCGKAVNRARLWEEGSRIDHTRVPSIGRMKAVLMGGSPDEADAVDAHYREAVRNDLY
nr:hypothetical protein [Azospirillum oleiclasticum]